MERKEVYCSFDKAGKYKIPQSEKSFSLIFLKNISDDSQKYFDTYEESFLLSSEEIKNAGKA